MKNQSKVTCSSEERVIIFEFIDVSSFFMETFMVSINVFKPILFFQNCNINDLGFLEELNTPFEIFFRECFFSRKSNENLPSLYEKHHGSNFDEIKKKNNTNNTILIDDFYNLKYLSFGGSLVFASDKFDNNAFLTYFVFSSWVIVDDAYDGIYGCESLQCDSSINSNSCCCIIHNKPFNIHLMNRHGVNSVYLTRNQENVIKNSFEDICFIRYFDNHIFRNSINTVKSLLLKSCQLDEEQLDLLSQAKQLKTLKIYVTRDINFFKIISQCKSLESLLVDNISLRDSDDKIFDISKLSSLQSLTVIRSNIHFIHPITKDVVSYTKHENYNFEPSKELTKKQTIENVPNFFFKGKLNE